MTVKRLKEILENVDPDLPVFVWNSVDETYNEATYACVDELYCLEYGEKIYNEETDDYEMANAFIITE